MKYKNLDMIVLRTFGAEHVSRPGFFCSWYLDNVIGDGQGDVRARVRRYWKGDCLDAFMVPDTETAAEIALTYEGPHSDEVRYIAACLAIGERPGDFGGGGQGARIDAPEPVLPSGGVTLDALIS